MLGNQGVTESNMMQYLGIIEQRTSEILQAYAASQQMTQAVETQVRISLPHTRSTLLTKYRFKTIFLLLSRYVALAGSFAAFVTVSYS